MFAVIRSLGIFMAHFREDWQTIYENTVATAAPMMQSAIRSSLQRIPRQLLREFWRSLKDRLMPMKQSG